MMKSKPTPEMSAVKRGVPLAACPPVNRIPLSNTRTAWLTCALLVTAIIALPAHAQQGSNIAETKHNLAASGPGSVKTSGSANSCAFCHTPHAASPIAPLWNREDPGTYYQTYESSTLVASVGQPTGSSRLCLSCHDGTIALAQTLNPLNSPGHTQVYLAPGDAGYLGTDLSDDHPISFEYTSALATEKGQLKDPNALPTELPLESGQVLQCTTCHDPHDDRFGKFLRVDNTRSALCRTCHEIDGFDNSSHANSSASLASATNASWTNLKAQTVADAGCESCHRPHTAGGHQRLLRYEPEENNCLDCHNATVARTDIASLLNSISKHPVEQTTGVHDPTENPLTMREHVECVDCHNPHSMTASGTAQAPVIRPSMAGASGLSDTGLKLDKANNEYEVCYKCHSVKNFATPVVDRWLGTDNIADEFKTTNASFHPVQTQGRSSSVPSLIAGYTTATVLYCTDCHTTNTPDKGKGPHGSAYSPMLGANYSVTDRTPESPQAYALCYKCHSRTSILEDQSFRKHKEHIDGKKTPCSVCHDPHGVRENTHLINFDRNVVSAASNGQGPTFTDLGNRRGSCTLSCHGENHINESY
ncbi:MAG: hypothetical protein GC164_08020 [Phycisphaera sp.]|nr:hypothetical protein [Phycisphaera sp.]